MSGPRAAYVAAVRTARRAADRTGLLGRMSRSGNPAVRHLRTLFAIHDVVDLARLDLAWWSYPAMRDVEAFLAARPGARVFEYGAGASTVWLARRAGEVHSVEHDAGFADHVLGLLDELGVDNATVRPVHPAEATPATRVRSGRAGHEHQDFGEYVAEIDRVGGEFDLIVVDGRARVEAFDKALEHLAPGGVIVFDNVRRKRYWDNIQRPGLRFALRRGATPALPYPTTTGLITRG